MTEGNLTGQAQGGLTNPERYLVDQLTAASKRISDLETRLSIAETGRLEALAALRDYHRDTMGTNTVWFEEAKKQAAKTVAALEAARVAEGKAEQLQWLIDTHFRVSHAADAAEGGKDG